ncbi:MAG: ferritin-like domain-containing protein [Lachnospiraceae bacterium]|nr:ferritin-like domain-containing protein [Lachnospiraceae bacterium]
MVLNAKETQAIKELQSQEQICIEKYRKYGKDAKDPVLKDLFQTLEQKEQQHYNTLGQILSGSVPQCDCNDTEGRDYNPSGTYSIMSHSPDKDADGFLATDSISTEKMVSSEYNSDVFTFGDTDIRKALAEIQIEEQNHAEMLYKYKTVNGMS